MVSIDPVGSRCRALGSACGRRQERDHLVALRRDVPGVSAQLRRRERRRRGRPPRAAGQAPLPGRPRRRRSLDLAVVPLADGRRGLRRQRLPRHTPDVRHPRGRRRGAARRPRARAAGDHRPRPQPHLRPAPVVPRGPRRGAGLARAGALLLPRRAGATSGEEPPNNWISAFGGPAWIADQPSPTGPPGSGTCTSSRPSSPTSTGATRQVLDDFDDVLRFWFDRGVDGLRIDAAPAMSKKAGLPDADYGGVLQFRTVDWDDNPHWDVDTVHDIFRRWRAIADTYDGDRAFVAEAVVSTPERLAHYLRPDEMHTAFNFPYLKGPWEAGPLREVIDDTLSSFAPIGVPSTWVLTSHDEIRPVTRYGRVDDQLLLHRRRRGRGLGPRARHATGASRRDADAGAARRGLRLPGRGARVCPTSTTCRTRCCRTRCSCAAVASCVAATAAGCRCRGAGRSRRSGSRPTASPPWLPQPEAWRDLTVEAQAGDPTSMLALYRDRLAAAPRDRRTVCRGARVARRPRRGPRLRPRRRRCAAWSTCPVEPVAVPSDRVLLSSIPLDGDLLPPTRRPGSVPSRATAGH